MPLSFKSRLAKLEHKGQISQEEYQSLITKLDGHDAQIRADAIEKCADIFAETLSNMPQICGRSCPVDCAWGTEETCKNIIKKWLAEQIKEQNK